MYSLTQCRIVFGSGVSVFLFLPHGLQSDMNALQQRVDVPESLKAADQSKLEISSTWGSPVASYPSTPECDMAPRFTKQKLCVLTLETSWCNLKNPLTHRRVITTTLCGQWAGLPQVRRHFPFGKDISVDVELLVL